MHEFLISATVGLYSAGVVNLLLGNRGLEQFLEEVPVITSGHEMELFRALVKRQMRAALLQIPLLGLPTLLCMTGFFVGMLKAADLWYVILPAVAVLIISWIFKKTEARVKRIPAGTKELEAERDAVIDTWMNRATPDW